MVWEVAVSWMRATNCGGSPTLSSRSFQMTFVVEPGNSLEHAALLPAPGIRGAEIGAGIAVFQIQHEHGEGVRWLWRAVFKGCFHAEEKPPGGIELLFVVVADQW